MIDMDRPCPHLNFSALVEVDRITDGANEGAAVKAYAAGIRVSCADCREPFHWIGVQAGARPDRPMSSVDETELRAPLRPASADPDFGLGIPGFAVSWTEGGR